MTPEETKQMLLDALSPLAEALSAALTSNETPIMPDISALETAIAELKQGSTSQQESLDFIAETIGSFGTVYATKTYASDIETRLIQLQKAVRSNIDSIKAVSDAIGILSTKVQDVATTDRKSVV